VDITYVQVLNVFVWYGCVYVEIFRAMGALNIIFVDTEKGKIKVKASVC